MKNRDLIYFETDTGRFAEDTIKQLNRLLTVPAGMSTIIATIAAFSLDTASYWLALNIVQDRPEIKLVICAALAGSIDLIPSIAADIIYKEPAVDRTDKKQLMSKLVPLIILGSVFMLSLISALTLSLDRMSIMSMFSAYEDVSDTVFTGFTPGQIVIGVLRGFIPLVTSCVIFMFRRKEILENNDRIISFCNQKLTEAENLKKSAEIEIYELEKDAEVDRKKYLLNDLNTICIASEQNARLAALDAGALIARKIDTPDMYTRLEEFNNRMMQNTGTFIQLPDLNARIESGYVKPILDLLPEPEKTEGGDITVGSEG